MSRKFCESSVEHLDALSLSPCQVSARSKQQIQALWSVLDLPWIVIHFKMYYTEYIKHEKSMENSLSNILVSTMHKWKKNFVHNYFKSLHLIDTIIYCIYVFTLYVYDIYYMHKYYIGYYYWFHLLCQTFKFDGSNYLLLFLVSPYLRRQIREILLNPMSKRVQPVFSSSFLWV